jgi:hypothetical protein
MIISEVTTKLVMHNGEMTVGELRRFVKHLDDCEYDDNDKIRSIAGSWNINRAHVIGGQDGEEDPQSSHAGSDGGGHQEG